MKTKSMNSIIFILFLSTTLLIIPFFAQAGETGQPVLNIEPNKGTPGTELLIIGSSFIPGEKVKVIMEVGGVPLQFGESGTGGISLVDDQGNFALKPRGGIPIAPMFVKPGLYHLTAYGDKGSKATATIEVLQK